MHSRDRYGIHDILCLASSRKIVAGAIEALKERSDRRTARKAFGKFVGDIARIEIAREEMARAMTAEMAAEFSRTFKQLGFKFVTLDLEGFRSGSMNTLLSPEQIGRAG